MGRVTKSLGGEHWTEQDGWMDRGREGGREGRGSFAAIDAVTILYSLGRQNQRDTVYVSSVVRGGVK